MGGCAVRFNGCSPEQCQDHRQFRPDGWRHLIVQPFDDNGLHHRGQRSHGDKYPGWRRRGGEPHHHDDEQLHRVAQSGGRHRRRHILDESTCLIGASSVMTNSAVYGGGSNIYNGSLSLTNVTVQDELGNDRAGIRVEGYATVSTTGGAISHNTATGNGGGVYVASGAVTLGPRRLRRTLRPTGRASTLRAARWQ